MANDFSQLLAEKFDNMRQIESEQREKAEKYSASLAARTAALSTPALAVTLTGTQNLNVEASLSLDKDEELMTGFDPMFSGNDADMPSPLDRTLSLQSDTESASPIDVEDADSITYLNKLTNGQEEPTLKYEEVSAILSVIHENEGKDGHPKSTVARKTLAELFSMGAENVSPDEVTPPSQRFPKRMGDALVDFCRMESWSQFLNFMQYEITGDEEDLLRLLHELCMSNSATSVYPIAANLWMRCCVQRQMRDRKEAQLVALVALSVTAKKLDPSCRQRFTRTSICTMFDHISESAFDDAYLMLKESVTDQVGDLQAKVFLLEFISRLSVHDKDKERLFTTAHSHLQETEHEFRVALLSPSLRATLCLLTSTSVLGLDSQAASSLQSEIAYQLRMESLRFFIDLLQPVAEIGITFVLKRSLETLEFYDQLKRKWRPFSLHLDRARRRLFHGTPADEASDGDQQNKPSVQAQSDAPVDPQHAIRRLIWEAPTYETLLNAIDNLSINDQAEVMMQTGSGTVDLRMFGWRGIVTEDGVRMRADKNLDLNKLLFFLGAKFNAILADFANYRQQTASDIADLRSALENGNAVAPTRLLVVAPSAQSIEPKVIAGNPRTTKPLVKSEGQDSLGHGITEANIDRIMSTRSAKSVSGNFLVRNQVSSGESYNLREMGWTGMTWKAVHNECHRLLFAGRNGSLEAAKKTACTYSFGTESQAKGGRTYSGNIIVDNESTEAIYNYFTAAFGSPTDRSGALREVVKTKFQNYLKKARKQKKKP